MDITRHAETCNHAFGRRTAGCPRCDELAAGATPRRGWGKSAKEKAAEHVMFVAYLRSQHCGHNATNPGGYCNVCGKGVDWS